MKRVLIYLVIILTNFVFLSNCKDNSSNEGGNEYDERPLIEYKTKIKEKLLPQFSDVRIHPDVISEREVMEGLIDELFCVEGYDFTYETLKNNPQLMKAKIGQIVLVESLIEPEGDKYEYYYYIDVVSPEGYVMAEATASSKIRSDNSGVLGMMCIQAENQIPTKNLTGDEAVKIIRDKYMIADANSALIKAIFLPRPNDTGAYFGWGWAVKFKDPIIIDQSFGIDSTYPVFWVAYDVYDFDAGIARKIINKERMKSFTERIHVAILNRDVFSDKVVRNIKNMSSRGVATDDYPQFIPLEYMAE